MQRIAVVCGAGASSTFLVHWMQKAAASAGLSVVISANSVGDMLAHPVDADVVLVGSHLDAQVVAITAAATASGASVTVLPPLTFDAAGAAEALRIATAPTLATTRSTDNDRN